MALHAIQSSCIGVDGCDKVGNQTERPDLTIAYTPFDLPQKYTRKADGAETLLEYDGDQTRVRKTTAIDETLYFGDYERVTHLAAPSSVLHRYAVWSDERIVAIVTQKNFQPAGVPGSRAYLHVDHLGSTEKLTDAAGAILERRSYDAFGARRNPDWTQKTLSTASRGTTLGYTGHEDEDDLGLVNMKGRILDPRLARFLTTDPLVARPAFSQSWNPYSYVMNSPLKYVDPTGFEPDPELVKMYGPGVEDTILVIGARIPDRDPSVDGRPPRDTDEVNRAGSRDSGAPQAYDYANPGQSGPNAGYMGFDRDPDVREHQNDEIQRNLTGGLKGLGEMGEGALTGNRALLTKGAVHYAQATNVVDPKTVQVVMAMVQVLIPALVPRGNGECVGDACTASCFIAGTPVRTNEGARGIERLSLGELVRTPGDEACSSVNWGDLWYVRFESQDNAELVIETLRSIDWIRAFGYHEGAHVYLTLQEIDFEGAVSVAEIGARKLVENGLGCPVLTKYSHLSTRVLDLYLAHSDTPIGTTATHPFFSDDRETWVHASDLAVGEHIVTMFGRTTVAGLVYTGHVERVFNIEVGLTHTYFAGESAAWVHNAGCGDYWSAGNNGSPENNLDVHFDKHGTEVGAKTAVEYSKMAQEFRRNLNRAAVRPTPVPGFTKNVLRFRQGGKYIDLDPNNKIVSFGK
jgi:RHS repeat-associated protein